MNALPFRIRDDLLPEAVLPLAGSLLREGAPSLNVSRLSAASILLGRHQNALSALSWPLVLAGGWQVARRAGGGRAARADAGTVVVHLALPRAWSLLPRMIPVDRVLNRYVRGLTAGLRRAGVPGSVFYPGRDFATASGRQVAMLSQDGLADGAVLFEALVAVASSFEIPGDVKGYPEHNDPRAGGPPGAGLEELTGSPVEFRRLAEAIGEGYASALGYELAPEAPASLAAPLFSTAPTTPAPVQSASALAEPAPVPAPSIPPGAAGLDSWPPVRESHESFLGSGFFEAPIGFVEAWLRASGGTIREARIRGDFIAPAFAVRSLEDSLAGCPAEFAEVGKRIDAAFRQRNACIHGVPDLRVFAAAILQAGRWGSARAE